MTNSNQQSNQRPSMPGQYNPGPRLRPPVRSLDFSQPLVLKGVRNADEFMRKSIGFMVVIAVPTYFLSMLVCVIALQSGLGYLVAVGVTAVVLAIFYVRKRSTLRKRFSQQMLHLSPAGLVKIDDCMKAEIAWRDIREVRQQNSAINTGGGISPVGGAISGAANAAKQDVSLAIIGQGRVSPVPGAPRSLLRAHDKQTGTRLSRGESTILTQAVIFPTEYEVNWPQGVVGAWLRHYRPDLEG